MFLNVSNWAVTFHVPRPPLGASLTTAGQAGLLRFYCWDDAQGPGRLDVYGVQWPVADPLTVNTYGWKLIQGGFPTTF